MFAYHLALQTGVLHAGAAGIVLAHGYLGVDGFFVLSGIVLTLSHPAVPWQEAPDFWARRLRRIYPVHAAVLLLLLTLLCLAAAAGVAPHDPGRVSAREFALHATLLQGWGFSRQWAWNYPSWSISTEWAGYLSFPVLAAAIARVPPRARLPFAAAVLVLLLPLADAGAGVGLNLTYAGALPRFFAEFVAGMLLACIPPGIAGRGGAAAWAALAAIPLGCALRLPDATVVLAEAAAMALLLARARAGGRALFSPAWSWLGVRSYAFYMSFATAEIVLAAAFRAAHVTPAQVPLSYVAAMTACTAALAGVLHACVERPWRSRPWRDRQSLPVTERV